MPSFLSGGVSVRIDQFEPSTPGPHSALLLLHGAGGNVGLWVERVAPLLTRLGIALYAVHYFERTGTERAGPSILTDGKHVPLWLATVGDALTYIGGRPGIDAKRIALLGISLGAYLSLALATEDKRVKAIVDLSGGLASPWDQRATAAFPPTLIVHGEADPVVPVSQGHALDRRLTELDVPHQTLFLPGEGHWFSPAAQIRILGAVAAFLGKYL